MSAKHWAIWIERNHARLATSGKTTAIWAQWCDTHLSYPPGLLRGPAPHQFRAGLTWGSRECSLWIEIGRAHV